LSKCLVRHVDCGVDGRLYTIINIPAAVADVIARIIAAEQLLPGQALRFVRAGVTDCHCTNHC
jgi:hypothetical protein